MTGRARLLATAVLLLPIVVYALAGVFSRLMADDFCFAVSGRQYGFPAVIPYYYDNWFGRITQIVGTVASTSLGTAFGQVFPAMVLTLWLIGLLWLCRELAKLLRLEYPAAAWLVAALILYGTLAGTPQIFHSLFWLSGVFPYTIPLVAGTFYAALVLRTLRLGRFSAVTMIASVGLVLVAGLSSEPFSVAFVGILALGILGLLMFRAEPQARRAALTLLVVGLLTALVALGIMVAAPGNLLRQGLFTPTHDLVTLGSQSLIYASASLVALVWFSPPALLLALIVPAVIAYEQPVSEIGRRRLRIWMALAAVIAFGLIVLVNVPAIYATSLPPPARVMIIPQFILVCALVVIGYTGGLLARKSIRRAPRLIAGGLIGLLLIAGPLLTAGQMIALMPKLNTYATEWDQREQQIVAAAAQGQQAVEVAPLSVDVASLTGLDRINTDASAFTNACAAQYYGIQSLVASG